MGVFGGGVCSCMGWGRGVGGVGIRDFVESTHM